MRFGCLCFASCAAGVEARARACVEWHGGGQHQKKNNDLGSRRGKRKTSFCQKSRLLLVHFCSPKIRIFGLNSKMYVAPVDSCPPFLGCDLRAHFAYSYFAH